jgi:DNA integrity scanning protein DisA with diadenylate cyclase activity
MKKMSEILCEISTRVGAENNTLVEVLTLAIELVLQGREGHKVGTMFIVGDSDKVFDHSRTLILDPLFGHPDSEKRVSDPGMRETVKELAQLDGAFIVSDDGVVLSASRLVSAPTVDIDIPKGLGSRHYGAASITRETKATAVVISKSSVIRVFHDGSLVSEVMPQKWFLSDYTVHLIPPYSEKSEHDITVLIQISRN